MRSRQLTLSALSAKPIAIINEELWELVRRRALGNNRIAAPVLERSRISTPVVKTKHHRTIDWDNYSEKSHLMTHCSIVASCCMEADGHTITPNSSKYVNENANAWSNDVLLGTYKTFIGASNYREHVQVPALRKGDVLDAVVREVNDNGEKIYYTDILLATERRHTDIVEDIADGKLNSLSMGCSAQKCVCSRCGKITVDNKENCVHLNSQLLHPYVDDKGIRRITAENCGVTGDPLSNIFVEASWVYHPAFKGAVIHNFVTPPRLRVASKQRLQRFQSIRQEHFLNFLDDSDRRMRVATRMAHVSALTTGSGEEMRLRDIARLLVTDRYNG